MSDRVFQLGDVRLSSGRQSKYKIEMDAAPDGDIECWAFLIAQMIGAFESVEGVPRGGLRLAAALGKYVTPNSKPASALHTHLLVDDVLTTSKTMDRAFAEHTQKVLTGSVGLIVGAVVYARGPCPTWIKAVCTVNERLWEV
jgi:TRAP-type C4-dicarboxylate transport system substrate-binding protein